MVPIAVWFTLALLIAAAIMVISGMAFWIAALIAIIAMFLNAFVAQIEDSQPGGINYAGDQAPPARWPRILFRIAGALIGAGGIWVGVAIFAGPEVSPTWWSRYVVPTGFILSGAYFLHYGLTGHSHVFRRG